MKIKSSGLISGPQPRAFFASAFALLATAVVQAQTVNTPGNAATVDPQMLAKYDRNQNGRLDENELAIMRAETGTAANAAATTQDDTIVLSPFQVEAEQDTGYYAQNTLSGARIRTNVEDLASSLSIVTKQQMADFAMLDINDIFLYEASTEGIGNFTDFEIDRNGMVNDRIQNNPQGSNRIRGMSAANIALGNFATSGRVPIDPINIDAIEISRGPNSNIFGIGEGSGTVNMIASTARFDRATTGLEFRLDNFGGYRMSVDLNRPLIGDTLAVRASAVYQHDDFARDPSGTNSRRYSLMVQARPFKQTTIRAFHQYYNLSGNRANSITPRDAVSWWQANGSPSWDPFTTLATVNGQVITETVVIDGQTITRPRVWGNTNPPNLGGVNFTAQPSLFVDENGIGLWMVNRVPGATAIEANSATANNGAVNNTGGVTRFLESVAEQLRGAARPLFATNRGVSDKSIYDWSEINLASVNRIRDTSNISTIELEQFILNQDKHKLAVQLAWQRENSDRDNRNIIGQASATGNSGYLYVDPNERLLNGAPNPYFGRPYLAAGEPVSNVEPYDRNSYRLQAAYIVDFSRDDGWSRWLGRHQVVGYGEYRRTDLQRFRFRDVIISDHPFNSTGPAATAPKSSQSGAAIGGNRGYFRYYVGDNIGQNVDHAPHGWDYGQYDLHWFLPPTSWQTYDVTLGRGAVPEGTGGNFATRTVIKTKGVVLQSYLLRDRVVITGGRRKDENMSKFGLPVALMPNRYEFDYEAMDGYTGDWRLREGTTTTKGIVVKPLSWLNLHYNESDSFRPETPAQSITLVFLPDPRSEGEDYGASFRFLDGKFILRVNHFENSQVNSRSGQSAIFATRTLRIDFNATNDNDQVRLQTQATQWVTAANPTWTTAQVQTEVASIMGLTPETLAAFNEFPITETSDVVSEGDEVELNFNPDRYWTLRLNVARNETVDANLSPNIPAWIAQRMPIWTSVIDPRVRNVGPDGVALTADDTLGAPWFTTRYPLDANGVPSTGNNMPQLFLTNNVVNPLAIVQANEGKARPQIREWRVNISTNLQLAKFFPDHRILRSMNVGGAIRWEDKGAIGYYGIPVNGNIEAATSLDPNRPIWAPSNTYIDAFVGYRTRLFDDRVGATFRLNVRNLTESGRLEAVGAYPNGEGHTFRIIDPRQFIFTASFEL